MSSSVYQSTLQSLQLKHKNAGTAIGGKWLESDDYISCQSPIDGQPLGAVGTTTKTQFDMVLKEAQQAFEAFRLIPAPKRGELVRQFGDKLRLHKEDLGKLVSIEMGKSIQEGLGEVQEMIDICDFAVGLSRQLHGLTMHSERPNHRMYEQYHPLGVVGIISAFNFPVAVWSWNVALAWVCGNVCIWKPSEKTPLCALACQKIIAEVLEENQMPGAVSCVVNGDFRVGEWISQSSIIPLVSATGSTKMGKKVAATVGARLGKSLLELGGNNAIIITPEADLDMAVIGAVFGAVGTCGQRCTSTRRLIVHESIIEAVQKRMALAYAQLKIGNPLDASVHVGPLIDLQAVAEYTKALNELRSEGARFVVEGSVLEGMSYSSGCYVKPAIALVSANSAMAQKETFAPILYLIPYKGGLDEAISIQNRVKQGLSSAIMTQNIREAELFLSTAGSDCGIANVNIGTSGAEIGGAFGGEKDTGGGRESGSDAWKIYMRRQTNTINYGNSLPLAQGIEFNL